MPRADGPARFQFTATWTVELGSGLDLDPIAPGKLSVLIQHGAAKLLELAGATGRVGAVTVAVEPAPEHETRWQAQKPAEQGELT